MTVNAPRQLTFDLPHRPALGAEDFLVADCNQDAVAWLDRWPDWPACALVLYGPPGCGKSHLAQVFAARSGAAILAASALGREDILNLAKPGVALVLEDADTSADERALLHLYNSLVQTGGSLLLTARRPPAQWPVALPDLASRLKAMPTAAIGAPDDSLMAAILVKLFSDRQIRIGMDAVEYLLRRMERSFAAAQDIAAKADAQALAEGRAVTVSLLRGLL